MSPRRSSQLGIEYVLLALLDQRPGYGYELYQELCALKGISLVWNIKQPLLYAILDKLEASGLLSSRPAREETYPPRKDFHLTDQGRSALKHWMQTPVLHDRDIRQEFLAKLIIARRYSREGAVQLIHQQEQVCQSWLDDLHARNPSSPPMAIDEWIVYSFRSNRVKAVLAWLGECVSEIERQGK